MSKVGSWSTTAGNNNSSPPDGWPEGQAPSTVNDCGREMMAQIRTLVSDIQYIDLNNTPSFLTSTSFSLGTTDTANWEVGRRVKLYDASTLYGTIISVSATFVQVRLDSGVLTSSLSSAALSVIKESNPALPDALYTQANVIFNGAMEIWQRTASIASIASQQYGPDRFRYVAVNTAAVNCFRAERSASATFVPTISSAGNRLNCSMRVVVSAADVAIAATDFAHFVYSVEGYDHRQIAHKPMAISFQVNTNCSGVYAVSFRNSASSISYVANYTLSAINTWTRVFIPIAIASPTSVTWDYSNGVGLAVGFTLAAGSSFQTTANEWTATQAIATSSQVNFLATAGNFFMITDVKLKAGIADTPVAYRPHAVELQLCQRYYEQGSTTRFFNATAAQEDRYSVPFAVTKRTTPTMTLGAATSSLNVASTASYNPQADHFDASVISTAAGPVQNDTAGWKADAELP